MGCQIPAEIVDREMYQLLMKVNRYLQEGAFEIARCVLLEFLYLLNHIGEPLTLPTVEDERVKNILLHINENLTGDLPWTAWRRPFLSINIISAGFSRQ